MGRKRVFGRIVPEGLSSALDAITTVGLQHKNVLGNEKKES